MYMVGNISETGEGELLALPIWDLWMISSVCHGEGLSFFVFSCLFLYIPLSFCKASDLILCVGAQILIQLSCVVKNMLSG